MSEEKRTKLLADLTDAQKYELFWDWKFWARPSQLPPPGDWTTWLMMAGRGWGKTRVGSEWVRSVVCGSSPLAKGKYSRLALVAETAADARDVLVEGESGILAVHPVGFRPVYESSKRRVTWPNGTIATLYNATEPDQLRGPQHDAAWCDELAKWRYAQATYDMLQFGLRLGERPQQIITTTPRPIPVLKTIMDQAGTVVTRGSTLENKKNLAASFLDQIVSRYQGTRLGRQELDAEIVDDVPGALWTRGMLDQCYVTSHPQLQRVVVAVDPSGTDGSSDGGGDSIGIVAAGLGIDGLVYVLADNTCNLSPAGWGRRVADTFSFYQADSIVAEKNFGGAMVIHVLHTVDSRLPVRMVNASRGKIARAEPVAALYEQRRVRHVGALPALEDQMVGFTPNGYIGERSPDRADALVWAITELLLADEVPEAAVGYYQMVS